tara:strand:+ start:631 stop:972 length:342 start_codon:yes stop_codon:yes gene_type:complete
MEKIVKNLESTVTLLKSMPQSVKSEHFKKVLWAAEQALKRQNEKESKSQKSAIPCVSEIQLPTEIEAKHEIEKQDKEAGYPEPDDYSDGYDKGFIDCVKWMRGKFYSRYEKIM